MRVSRRCSRRRCARRLRRSRRRGGRRRRAGAVGRDPRALRDGWRMSRSCAACTTADSRGSPLRHTRRSRRARRDAAPCDARALTRVARARRGRLDGSVASDGWPPRNPSRAGCKIRQGMPGRRAAFGSRLRWSPRRRATAVRPWRQLTARASASRVRNTPRWLRSCIACPSCRTREMSRNRARVARLMVKSARLADPAVTRLDAIGSGASRRSVVHGAAAT